MTNPKIATESRHVTIKENYADVIRIYIPTSRKLIAEQSLSLAKAQLLAGGWTCRRVEGGWVDPFGKTIFEPVDEHEFLVNRDKAQAVRKYLIALSEELLAAGEQAVLLVVQHSSGPTITYTMS